MRLRSARSETSTIAALRQLPMLAGCSKADLAEVARRVDHVSVGPGTTLAEEGRLGREAFIILDGWAAVTVHGEPVAPLGRGQFVGEMAMIDNRPRCATVTAKTPMELLVIGPNVFTELVSIPSVARALHREFTGRVRRSNRVIAGGA